jgi:hypothetical protein
VRGVAGELVAAETELPDGWKVKEPIPSSSGERTSDFLLEAPDGGFGELEVKAYRPENWDPLIDEYEVEMKKPKDKRKPTQVGRLVEQVEAGAGRARKMYVGISDGTPLSARNRLIAILRPFGFDTPQLVLLSESSIKAVAKALREHMGIPQPGGRR